MGKKKRQEGTKRHNWEARQVVEIEIDDRATKKIKLDLNTEGNYGGSNALALPSKKRNTRKTKLQKIQKILSKKQRKKLEKIVEKKEKRLARADLLENLSKVQAMPEELQQLTSITTTQTKGLKRANIEERYVKNNVNDNERVLKISSIKGSKRDVIKHEREYDRNDPNILGSESSGSSESETDEDADNDKNEVINVKEIKTEDQNDGCDEVTKNIDSTAKHQDKIKEKEVIEDKISRKNKTLTKITKNVERKPAVFVEVHRSEEIQKQRLKLPILSEEQKIMEIINENDVIIIAGKTGSGKTTQVPQFLYEAGYATGKIIGITEPRRIAATSMSKRVAHEMNLTTDEVSYLIRFEGNVTEETKIKFMTDGVLMRELKNDILLNKYSVIILDEAHERSVYTDVLIGMLSRIVAVRRKENNPIKLIIMSATLRLIDFTENKKLFKTVPPVIDIDARQFPVTVHFERKTNENYLREALKKSIKIHRTLPSGGILIFVTGQKEVNYLVRKLREYFPLKQRKKVLRVIADLEKDTNFNKKNFKIIPEVNLDDYEFNDEEINSENENVSDDEDDDLEIPTNVEPLWVLPLYSFLASDKQAEVFKPPPNDCRLCVVSTNVAETSLTIPNIKYVVDSGKTKEKLYDQITGVSTYNITWTSKASAEQRTGRAGRTGPGHCYRLYSSAVYNDTFREFSIPDIQKKPVDDLYLQMKSLNLFKILNFPFPTSPDLIQLTGAEKRLQNLDLLDDDTRITTLGRMVAQYPLIPRFGKMLAFSHQHGLLPYTILMVAALSIQEVLEEIPLNKNESNTKDWNAKRRKWAGNGNSQSLGDIMVLIKAVGGAEFANFQGKLEKFCQDNGLRLKAIQEIRKLRLQLTNEIRTNIQDVEIVVDPKLSPPSEAIAMLLRQILLSGSSGQVAKKIDLSEINDKEEKRRLKNGYMANEMEEPVFLHRNSVLFKELPEYVIYQEVYETNKMYIRGITAIEPEWLPVYVPKLCNLSKPLTDPEPWCDGDTGKVMCMVSGTFGIQGWPLPNTPIEYPKNIEAYKFFAKFFLEGKVFPRLERYKSKLLNSSETVTKSWGKLQPRVVKLLNTLVAKDCRNKTSVQDIWESDKKFLLDEYLLWLPDGEHSIVSILWPPL